MSTPRQEADKQRSQVRGRTMVAASISQALATLTPVRWSEPRPRSRPKEADRGYRLLGGPLTDEVAPTCCNKLSTCRSAEAESVLVLLHSGTYLGSSVDER